jgi:hypothetical protein
MKTLSRILIILTAFAIVMGITYMIVGTGGSSSSLSAPEVLDREGFAPPTRERPEMGSVDIQGVSWIFGLGKNLGVVAVIVVLIVIPKNFLRRKAIPVRVR